MNVKISFFNKKIFTKNLTKMIPFTLLMGIILLLITLSEMKWLFHGTYMDAVNATDSFEISGNLVKETFSRLACDGFVMALLIFYSFCCGVSLFRYLFSQRQCKTIHALPISRDGMYCTNILSGLVLLALPLISTALIIGAYIAANGFHITYVLPWLGVTFGFSLFFFSLTIFTLMLVGHIVALPVMYMFLNVGFFVIENIFIALVHLMVYGMSPYAYRAAHTIFSPLIHLCTHLDYDSATASFSDKGVQALIIYAVVAAALLSAGMLLYRKRPLEMQGEPIVFRKIQPVFHYIATFIGGCAITIILAQLTYLTDSGNLSQKYELVLLLILFLLSSTLSYYVVKMLLAKSIHVFKTGYIGLLAYIGVATATFACLSLDIFGFEKRMPDKADISYVEVDFNTQHMIFNDKHTFDTLLKCHQAAIENKEFIMDALMDDDSGNYYYAELSFYYYLKNDTLLLRTYTIPVNAANNGIPENVLDIAEDMAALYNNKETLLSAIKQIRTDYEVNDLSIYQTTYHEYDNEEPEDTFDEDICNITLDYEAEFFNAITEDIRSGALTLLFPNGTMQEYTSVISISYSVPNTKNGANAQDWHSLELAVTKECENTLAFFEMYNQEHVSSR